MKKTISKIKLMFAKIFLIFLVTAFSASAYVIEPNEVFTDTFESITFNSLIISGTLMFANNGIPNSGELRQIIITNGDFILASGGLVTQSFDILNLSSNGIDGANGEGGENPTAGENGGDGFGFGAGGNGGNGGTRAGRGGIGGKLGGNGGDGGIGYNGYIGFGDNGPGSEGGNGGDGGIGNGGANGFTVMVVNTTIAGKIKIDGNISLSGIKGGGGGNGRAGGQGGGWGGHGGASGYAGGQGGEGQKGGDGGLGADILFISTNGTVFLNNYYNFVTGGYGGNGGNGGDGGDGGFCEDGVCFEESGSGNDGGNGGDSGDGGDGGSITVIASTIIQNESTSVFSHIEKLNNGGFQGDFGNGGTKGVGNPNGINGISGQAGQMGKEGYVYFNSLSDTNEPFCFGNPIISPPKNSILQVGDSFLLSYYTTNFFDDRTLTDSLRHTIEIVSSNNVFGKSFLQVGEPNLLNREPFNNLYFIPVINMINQHFLFRFITKDLAGNISTNIFYDQVFSVIYEEVKADFNATPLQGDAPLNVNFIDISTNIPQFWFWDFDNNGVVDSTNRNPNYTYTKGGSHTVSLVVSNNLATNVFSINTCIKTNYINVAITTNYVSLDGKHIPPFDSWENAATNIQNAIDNATDYSVILVSNGTYFINSEISMQKPLILKSLTGAENCIFDGKRINRCIYIGVNSILDGFTIRNGRASGSNRGVLTVLGTLQNCIIKDNFVVEDWCGVIYLIDGLVENCLVYNISFGEMAYSAAICTRGRSIIRNATIINSDMYSIMVHEDVTVALNTIASRVSGLDYWMPEYYGYLQCYNCSINRSIANCSLDNSIRTNDFGFVNASNNDFHLTETSPCIDKGNNIYVETEKDLSGNQRIINGTVDIGAYEFGAANFVEIESAVPTDGITIEVSQLDTNDFQNGVTPFTRNYYYGTAVTLTAPENNDIYRFSHWEIDDVNRDFNKSIEILLNKNHVVKVFYFIEAEAAIWKYKNKRKTDILIGKNISPALGEYFETHVIGMKNGKTTSNFYGPNSLEPNRNGKIWKLKKKKELLIKYATKNNKLIYKVWTNMPNMKLIYLIPNETTNDFGLLDSLHIKLDSIESENTTGWQRLIPTIIYTNKY